MQPQRRNVPSCRATRKRSKCGTILWTFLGRQKRMKTTEVISCGQ